MKLYKYLTIAASLAFGSAMTGCSDWLDYTPKDKQSYEQIFSTETGFHTTVNGIYNTLTSNALYGYNLSYGPIEAMGLSYNISNSAGAMYECRNATYTGTYASSILTNIWSTAYKTILNANLVIEALDEFPGVLSESDANIIEAEMLALRAYLHFDLTRIFGPIPATNISGLAVPYAESSDVVKRDRLPADVLIKDYVLRDLSRAEEILAKYDPILTDGVLNSSGETTADNWSRYRQLRLNYYAVILLKARAYMWLADYSSALAEAKKITDSPKVAETFPWVVSNRLLGNSTNPDRIFSTECLFGFYNNSMSDIYQNYFSSALQQSTLLQPVKGYVSDVLFSSRTADYRYQAQWVANSSLTGGFEFVKYKSFTTNSNNPDFWATFYGLLRISEAYYIASESALNLNDTSTSLNYLNTVLEARGVPALADNTTVANLQKEIELEYARELRGEGQNFFQLKRYNCNVGIYYSPNKSHLNASAEMGTDSPSKANRYNVPIPSGETY